MASIAIPTCCVQCNPLARLFLNDLLKEPACAVPCVSIWYSLLTMQDEIGRVVCPLRCRERANALFSEQRESGLQGQISMISDQHSSSEGFLTVRIVILRSEFLFFASHRRNITSIATPFTIVGIGVVPFMKPDKLRTKLIVHRAYTPLRHAAYSEMVNFSTPRTAKLIVPSKA